MIRPMVDCGVISRETGQWEGVTTSDEQMLGVTISLGVPNTGEILVPDTDAFPSIDMTGYSGLFVAIKPSNAGNYEVTAVMGPDTLPFGGLSPVRAAATLRGFRVGTNTATFDNALNDGTEALAADVWNIFSLMECLKEQKNMQFKIVNNTGGNSDIEFAFMRVV